MKIKIKDVFIDVKKCNGLERFIGLMFCRREKAKALLFEFEKPVRMRIHSWFVFFPFLGVWIDENNKIIEMKSIKPFKFAFCPEKSFCKLIEIPLNKRYEEILQSLDES